MSFTFLSTIRVNRYLRMILVLQPLQDSSLQDERQACALSARLDKCHVYFFLFFFFFFACISFNAYSQILRSLRRRLRVMCNRTCMRCAECEGRSRRLHLVLYVPTNHRLGKGPKLHCFINAEFILENLDIKLQGFGLGARQPG